jgi:isochorismate synthase
MCVSPELFDQRLAEFINSASFAFFQPPGGEISLVLQHKGEPYTFCDAKELDGCLQQGGFVIAPFYQENHKPIILIKPDILLRGQQLFDFMEQKSGWSSLMPGVSPVSTGSAPVNTCGKDAFTAYSRAFTRFAEALRHKEDDLIKLVLSRTLLHELPDAFSLGAFFLLACRLFKESFVYLCHTPHAGLWAGCSPEPLLTGMGQEWNTAALAGTMPYENKNQQWDEKNILEQRIVADYMAEQLREAGCAYTCKGPVTVQAGKLLHLRSDFHFTLPSKSCTYNGERFGLGRLLALLHPSPAVCGFPKLAALDFINRHEGYDRGYYAGYMGFIAATDRRQPVAPWQKSTTIYVNLRCLRFNEKRAILYAGGGLLPDSILKDEWRETENKLETMLTPIKFTGNNNNVPSQAQCIANHCPA